MDIDSIGDALRRTWMAVGKYSTTATGDEFIVMPNHVHGIIFLNPREQPPQVAPRGVHLRMSTRTGHPIVEPGSLGAIVRAFKSASAKRVNCLRGTPGLGVWQRGYHERIIRNDDDLERIGQYIRDNPLKWDEDPNNPKNARPPT